MATTRRQRGQAAAAAAPGAAAAAAGAPPSAPPTAWDYARFALFQHAGLVLCVLGLGLLCFGYKRDWMHDTHLSVLSLGLCLLGLFLHETRPYKREDEFKQQMASDAAAKSE